MQLPTSACHTTTTILPPPSSTALRPPQPLRTRESTGTVSSTTTQVVSPVCKVTCQCSRVYRPILRFLCSPARLPRARPRAHAKGDICDSGMQTHKYCKEYAHYTTNSGVSTTDIYFLWQFWAIPCSSSHTILNIQYLIIEMHVGQDRQAQGADIR